MPVIQRYTGSILAGAVRTSVWNSLVTAGKSVADCAPEDYIAAALPGLRSYVRSEAQDQCELELRAALQPLTEPASSSRSVTDFLPPSSPPLGNSSTPLTIIAIESDADVVRARNEARRLCAELSYGVTDTVRCCTVVSELARNIAQYAKTGTIELREASGATRGISIVARDNGPGIADLGDILAGNYVSKTGMGRGLLGSRAILEKFDVVTRRGEGTTVRGVFRAR